MSYLHMKKNFKFDIINMNKYHWKTVQQKEYLQNLKNQKRKRYARNHELRKDESLVIKLTLTLNLIRTRIYDAFHSE